MPKVVDDEPQPRVDGSMPEAVDDEPQPKVDGPVPQAVDDEPQPIPQPVDDEPQPVILEDEEVLLLAKLVLNFEVGKLFKSPKAEEFCLNLSAISLWH